MGSGDNLIASGMARGAAARGRRIAFGDGKTIIWDKHSKEIFFQNPNVAPPGHETATDLEWIGFHKGSRIYNRQEPGRWVWNYDFRPTPGEMFFTFVERRRARVASSGTILIEPHVPRWKTVAANKDWGWAKYQAVTDRLVALGYSVAQFHYGSGPMLKGARPLVSGSFRGAMAMLEHARIYIGPEGGLHHGAAAVGKPAVVLFGGFIPPQVTGYETHTNLTGGAEACGSLQTCAHCRAAMDRISVEEVVDAALKHLGNTNVAV